jgi:hypothetical protein
MAASLYRRLSSRILVHGSGPRAKSRMIGSSSSRPVTANDSKMNRIASHEAGTEDGCSIN